jgi:hypothetical protein
MREAWGRCKGVSSLNLTAAERFYFAYEGEFDAVGLAVQAAGKAWREDDMIVLLRKLTPEEMFALDGVKMLLGRNGTPASSVPFTTRWALRGLWCRHQGWKPGQALP